MNTKTHQLLMLDDVRARLNICRSHVYKLMKTDSSFPKPIRLGTAIRWRADDVEKFIEGKATEASK